MILIENHYIKFFNPLQLTISLILFENQIQTTSASPYLTQVQIAVSFLVCSLIFIEYEIQKRENQTDSLLIYIISS